jgi:SAM-dependent methyltransferase
MRAGLFAYLTRRRAPVALGNLETTEPASRAFGFDRGTPIDRHYIERFLERNAGAVRGRVLEIGDDEYTRRFGGDAVDSVDVLHAGEGNPQATVVADLTDAPQIPDASYDCVICTQTLLLIYDVPAAVATIRRILRRGGTALVTVPGVSRICRAEAGEWGDFWRFTSMSARRLFEDGFAAVDVETYGNVLAATAQLHGIASEELDPAALDEHDPDFEVVIGVRASA